MPTDPAFWAFAIFGLIPLGFIGWCMWLRWSVAPDMPEHLQQIGDATETPTMLRNVRKSNHKGLF